MATIADLLSVIESIAPKRLAFEWDRIGLLVGATSDPANRILVSLDASLSAVDAAVGGAYDVLLAHHPLIWDPIKTVRTDQRTGRLIGKLLKGHVAHVCAHTNWDAAPGGVCDALAQAIGLQNVQPGQNTIPNPLVKLQVNVPTTHRAEVVAAASALTGQMGQYDSCAFWTTGTGQFRPLPGSTPTLGSVGRIEQVAEDLIEFVIEPTRIDDVMHAIRAAHPYEEVAYAAIPLANQPSGSYWRMGEFSGTASELKQITDHALGCQSWLFGPADKPITKVATIGGAGSEVWPQALAAGADALVLGEIPHHLGLECGEAGLVVIAAGHAATEQPGVVALAKAIQAAGWSGDLAIHPADWS